LHAQQTDRNAIMKSWWNRCWYILYLDNSYRR